MTSTEHRVRAGMFWPLRHPLPCVGYLTPHSWASFPGTKKKKKTNQQTNQFFPVDFRAGSGLHAVIHVRFKLRWRRHWLYTCMESRVTGQAVASHLSWTEVPWKAHLLESHVRLKNAFQITSLNTFPCGGCSWQGSSGLAFRVLGTLSSDCVTMTCAGC